MNENNEGKNNMNENNEELLGICRAITTDEITNLKAEYLLHRNSNQTVQELCNLIFRKVGIRTISELDSNEDESQKALLNNIITDFCLFASKTIVKHKPHNKKIVHKAGDFVVDSNGNKILADDGSGYKTYDKTTVETIEEQLEIPYYDYTNKPADRDRLLDLLRNETVIPDLQAIRQQMLPDNFEEGKKLIRKITKYFIFEEPETFVERFALLICNAKAKALNIHPKWSVLFSLVGDFGKGKGWLRDMIAKTYDEVFYTKSNPGSYKALLQDFNSLMLTRGFVLLDEKNGLDANQCEQLKTLITEPNILINQKYKDVKNVRNLVTFFSCSNESIKDVMGLQKDRRIIEFTLVGKNGEMPEQELHDLLIQLWKIMPVDCPVQDKVISELLEESTEVLDTRMEEILIELYRYWDAFTHGSFVNLHNYKETVKKNIGGVSHSKLFDWLIKKDIFKRQRNGAVTWSKKILDQHISENLFIGKHEPLEISSDILFNI